MCAGSRRLVQPPGRPRSKPGRMTDGNTPTWETVGPPPVDGGPGFPPPWRGGPEPRVPCGLRVSSNLAKSAFPRTLACSSKGHERLHYAIWSRAVPCCGTRQCPVDLCAPRAPDAPTAVPRADAGLEPGSIPVTELGECVLAGRSIRFPIGSHPALCGWLVAAGGAVLAFGLGGGCCSPAGPWRRSKTSALLQSHLRGEPFGAHQSRRHGQRTRPSGRRVEFHFSPGSKPPSPSRNSSAPTPRTKLRTPIAVLISRGANHPRPRTPSAAEYRDNRGRLPGHRPNK